MKRLRMEMQKNEKKLSRVPTDKPPFTLTQIKNTIPSHCFNRSLIRSFPYLIYDLSLSALLFYFAHFLVPSIPSYLQLYLAWPLYWLCQGFVLTGIWTIAHECGHNAFSNYPLLDDIVGFVIHSAMCVPYFSFKISHRRHHNHNAHLEHDQIFVPGLKSQLPWYQRIRFFHNPPARLVLLLINLLFGWPMYLIFNYFGGTYNGFPSHFDPYAPIYSDKERALVVISDIGVVTMLSFLYGLGVKYGIWWLVSVYVIPQIFLSACVVTLTYLSHTHMVLPRYDSSEWDFMRGALATVDRDFGMLNKVFHDITHTHVVHHLFPRLPHYHAKEATEAIIPLLGEYYKFDDTPVMKALWREVRQCVYVEKDEGTDAKNGVFWYRSKLD